MLTYSIICQNIDIKRVDEAFCLYIIEHNKNDDYYLIKCSFQLVFNDKQYCPYDTSELYSKKIMCSWYKFLENVISKFKDKGYNLNHIAEMNIITIANKLDMSYDFNIKQNMCALEWKLNAMITKNKNLINTLNRNWRHPLKKKVKVIMFDYYELIVSYTYKRRQ